MHIYLPNSQPWPLGFTNQAKHWTAAASTWTLPQQRVHSVKYFISFKDTPCFVQTRLCWARRRRSMSRPHGLTPNTSVCNEGHTSTFLVNENHCRNENQYFNPTPILCRSFSTLTKSKVPADTSRQHWKKLAKVNKLINVGYITQCIWLIDSFFGQGKMIRLEIAAGLIKHI